MHKWSKQNNIQPTRVTTSITILSLSWHLMRDTILPEGLKFAHEELMHKKTQHTHTETVTYGNHKVQIRFLFKNQIQET